MNPTTFLLGRIALASAIGAGLGAAIAVSFGAASIVGLLLGSLSGPLAAFFIYGPRSALVALKTAWGKVRTHLGRVNWDRTAEMSICILLAYTTLILTGLPVSLAIAEADGMAFSSYGFALLYLLFFCPLLILAVGGVAGGMSFAVENTMKDVRSKRRGRIHSYFPIVYRLSKRGWLNDELMDDTFSRVTVRLVGFNNADLRVRPMGMALAATCVVFWVVVFCSSILQAGLCFALLIADAAFTTALQLATTPRLSAAEGAGCGVAFGWLIHAVWGTTPLLAVAVSMVLGATFGLGIYALRRWLERLESPVPTMLAKPA